jgi:hypothetical protein
MAAGRRSAPGRSQRASQAELGGSASSSSQQGGLNGGRRGQRAVGHRAVAATQRVAAVAAFQSAAQCFEVSKWVLLGTQGERSRAPVQNFYVPRLARYIRWLTDEYTATYIHRLVDDCTGPTFVIVLYNHWFWYQGI